MKIKLNGVVIPTAPTLTFEVDMEGVSGDMPLLFIDASNGTLNLYRSRVNWNGSVIPHLFGTEPPSEEQANG